jgi:DNA-binding phage protein
MSARKVFNSVRDAIEDTPEGAARMKVLSALKMGLLPDLIEQLQAAAYLIHIFEGGEASTIEQALRQVAQSRGLALEDDGEGLLFSDVIAVLRAVGLHLSVQPAKAIP